VRGLGARIFFATAAVIVVVLGGALLLTKRRADLAADASLSRALAAAQSAVSDELSSRSQTLLQVTAGLARVPTYVAQLSKASGSAQADLLDRAQEFRSQTGAAWTLITDNQGLLRAWTLHRDLAGEDFSEGAVVGLALEGKPAEGIWIEPGDSSDQLFQSVGVPVKDPNGNSIYGVLVAALPIDSAFSAELRRHTASEIAFFIRDSTGAPHVTMATLPREPLERAIAALQLDSTFAGSTAPTVLHLSAGGEPWVGVVGPLRTADGRAVAGFAALRSRGAELAPYTALQQTLVWSFGAGLLLALVSALVIARQVTQPVRQLVSLTRDVSEGRFPEKFEVSSRDEVGELASAFGRMVADLKQKQELVEYLQSTGGAPTVELAVTPPGGGPTQPGGPPRSAPRTLRPGQVLADRYEIKEALGAGGMGVVYRAWDRQLQEPIAIKTLRPEVLQADQTSLERFKQEIRLARRITHRNVLRTHDLGEVDGAYFITMEYAEGTSLADLLRKRGRLPVGVALTIGKQLCRALEVAHDAGVIHRDIKPQNLMIDPAGFLKVMDFGIARLAEGHRPGEAGLTRQGMMIGTPEYMSPEQLLAVEVDGRADLYAVGAVLFECVTGRSVFQAPSVTALIAAQLQEPPGDPRQLNPEVSEAFARVILKALAKDRGARWQSAKEMFEALERV
jgi:eukaryotic-like serine/threonine-protein kinase